jgi:hypothetical protein
LSPNGRQSSAVKRKTGDSARASVTQTEDMPRFRRLTLLFVIVTGALIVGLPAAFAAGTKQSQARTLTPVLAHGAALSALYPGTSASIDFTVDRPSSSRSGVVRIHLASIVACDTAFAAGVCPSGHEVPSCESIDNGSRSNRGSRNFYMADVVKADDMPSGDDHTVTASGILTMNNLPSSQDGCKGVSLLLNLTV